MSTKTIETIITYLKGNISLEDLITQVRSYREDRTIPIQIIKLKKNGDMGCTREEADVIVKYTLYNLLVDETIIPGNAETRGYEWVNDTIFPTEAPNEVILKFIDEMNENNWRLGKAAGTFPEELVGIYSRTQ